MCIEVNERSEPADSETWKNVSWTHRFDCLFQILRFSDLSPLSGGPSRHFSSSPDLDNDLTRIHWRLGDGVNCEELTFYLTGEKTYNHNSPRFFGLAEEGESRIRNLLRDEGDRNVREEPFSS